MPYEVYKQVGPPYIRWTFEGDGPADPYDLKLLAELDAVRSAYFSKFVSFGKCAFCGGPTPCLRED